MGGAGQEILFSHPAMQLTRAGVQGWEVGLQGGELHMAFTGSLKEALMEPLRTMCASAAHSTPCWVSGNRRDRTAHDPVQL